MALPIEQYALLGDTHSAALVGANGSIDWLCLPRFDSPAVFAALLGDEEHGCWRLAPAGEVISVSRRYRGPTMILETEFATASGRVRVTDFMPPRDRRIDLRRRVEGLDGEVEMAMLLVIRFGYGEVLPWVRRVEVDGEPAITATAGPDAVCFRGDVLPQRADHQHRCSFAVRAGDTLDFSLTWYDSHQRPPRPQPLEPALARTESFWSRWAGRCRYSGRYADAVIRSTLTLKALTYHPTGGIVAAPTTSLPEQLGGARNWDYRYCWLRDAALTLRALLATGHREEARRWRDWLLRAVAGDPADLQILYGVAGERRIGEWVAEWLPGYQGAAPVRIGNAAHRQYQADVYGEVLGALHHARLAGIAEDGFSWPLQKALLGQLEQTWDQPDNGIWEVRGPQRHFTHSRVMVWVALDCAIRAVEDFGLPGPAERWRALRKKVHDEVCEAGFDSDRGAFTQYYGGRSLDASLLQMPHLGFLPGDDPRVVGTVEAIERELREGPLVYRYSTGAEHDGQTVDGLPPGEGAFLACGFWLVRAYALIGRRDDARSLFEELLELANDVGLYAEEHDPAADRMTGNFPQAFSHLALLSAADSLEGAGLGG
ncbi:MAG: glycoside hydrolase family 15 protein [Micromonosporaceae bacterium]|nr:glycoside hydrolase family 15 protein [Micromonosporaceae bacterium]